MEQNAYYVGLMSGTSADAIDVVVVDIANDDVRLIGNHSAALPPEIRKQIHALATPADNEIDRMGTLDQQLGELFANTINDLLKQLQLTPNKIQAIGSHGQTIRHRPPRYSELAKTHYPFTLQIGDPNVIAQRTGITTIADFRRRDMAAGGHGAPLVPAFHKAAFQTEKIDRAIVNIGGMANITWLPQTGETLGFDTGPGNVLMDAWILQHLGRPYDANGDWAATGQTDHSLLGQFLAHPFFAEKPPKSTGRESFNIAWLRNELRDKQLAAENVQATLLALTATSIANEIKKLIEANNKEQKICEVFICGGGAYNLRLLKVLQEGVPACTVKTTTELGIAPEWIEAMAFAWMAKQTLQRQSSNLTAVTGAKKAVILGGVYFA